MDVIASAGDKLWKELVGDAKIVNVTSVQLAFTGLEPAESGQQSIEGFFKTPRQQILYPEDGGPSLKRVRDEDTLPGIIALEGSALTSPDDSTSFTCPRCGKRLYLADHSGPEEDKALAILRVEHEDFHFAQDLATTSDEKDRQYLTKKKKKKKQKEPEGIAKFFSKK